MDKINLPWGELHPEHLTQADKVKLLDELSELAKRLPKGFDYNTPDETYYQVLEFLKDINCVYEEVAENCIAIYQNNNDRLVREARR